MLMRSNPSSEKPRLVAANGGGGDANGLTVQTRAPLLREESLMSGAGLYTGFTLVDRCLKPVDV